MIIHPHPDPVAVEIFGFAIHWYGIMYLVGLCIAWGIGSWLLRRASFAALRGIVLEDLIVAAALGIIVGGRLGYVLFYNPAYYANAPLEILHLWAGGMSFHGGLIGVIVALWFLARAHSIPAADDEDDYDDEDEDEDEEEALTEAEAEALEVVTSPTNIFLRLVDFAAVLTPPGLGLGRLGNFINAELPGRVADADLPWAMSFGYPDYLPRHPSQLYQMFVEGFILAGLMLWLASRPRPPGWLAGAFLTAYGIGRFGLEFFREPDAHLGLLWLDLSMGQWLSLPLIMLGLLMMYRLRLVAIWSGQDDAEQSLWQALRKALMTEPDVSWNVREQTFADTYGDEETVATSRLREFFNSLVGQRGEEEDEYVKIRLTRRQKRRLRKKKRKR